MNEKTNHKNYKKPEEDKETLNAKITKEEKNLTDYQDNLSKLKRITKELQKQIKPLKIQKKKLDSKNKTLKEKKTLKLTDFRGKLQTLESLKTKFSEKKILMITANH